MRENAAIELLDAGDGRRLERFGDRVVDRPAPGATDPPRAPDAWAAADLRFEAAGGWSGSASQEPWLAEVDGLSLELRPTASGGVGLFPEQLVNLGWLETRIGERVASGDEVAVLNLFAHTGLLTLAAARAGASVVHLDAARAAVGWARRNADLSGLVDRPVRWLVEDAAAFVSREARRRRRYDGLILDPPSYGRSGARRWRLVDDLPRLLDACGEVMAEGAFMLLTAHTTGLDGGDLANLASRSLGNESAEVVPLRLDAASGATLELGWAVRHGSGPGG